MLIARSVNALIVYLVIGLAAGLLVPLIAGRPAMGLTGSCLVGAMGAFIGGVLGSYSVPVDQFTVVRVAGVIHASIGAVLTLGGVIFVHAARKPSLLSLDKKSARRWRDGLLASDRRSFETISKQHQQRMP